jgi:mRNA-degrading endonuclease RelE of RelBE toxin-antitoxin system
MEARRIEILPSFQQAYDTLAPDLQQRVEEALVHFSERSADNALRPELKNGFENVWSIRIGSRYRAFYKKLRDSDGAIFCMFHIGHHDDYRQLKKLSSRVTSTTHVNITSSPGQSISVSLRTHANPAAKTSKR